MVYGDDGSCPAEEFCTVNSGCRAIPSGPAELAVENLTVFFSTPNTVRWEFTAAGDNRELRHYRIEHGAAPDALDVRVEPSDNPELEGDIWFRAGSLVRTTTSGHTAGTTIYARVVGVDWFGREAASPVVMTTLPDIPANQIEIFADAETAGYSIPGHVALGDSDPFQGTHAYEMLHVCDDTSSATCFEIMRRQEIEIDLSAVPAAAFDTAYVEFSVQVDTPGAHSRYCSVRLMLGPEGDWTLFNYEGYTIVANGTYRTYQIPLTQFGMDTPLTAADLLLGLREFGVGGSWAVGSTVRWDEVRLFY